MKKIILLFWILALLSACASTEKMLEKGDYEGLISKATHKLTGHKKKDIYVDALELGFKKLTNERLAEIDRLKFDPSARNWEQIIRIGVETNNIQNLIAPLLPLVSESGHRASFHFINTNDIIAEAQKNAAALYFARLNLLKEDAYKGIKTAAREAVGLIDRIDELSHDYELNALRNDMVQKGINKIGVLIEDRSYARLTYRAEDELHYIPVNNTLNQWNQFYTEITETADLDYKVVFRINELRSTPDAYHTVENKFFRDIKDGWEYILDTKGNVAKDTLGNDIKKDRHVNVKATIVETQLTKRAYISGYMDVINMKTGSVSYSRAIQYEDCFSHTARNYFGDERALDNNQKYKVLPVSAPDDLEMMMRVVEKAKREFLNAVNKVNYI